MAREINIVLRVVLDFVCLLAVGLPILILYLVGKPYQRGFYCDDETIRYPFKPSTITNNVLYVVGIFVPLAVIIITEVIRHKENQEQSRLFLRWRVHPLIWDLYRKIGYFAFGACLSQLTTDIAKYSIGRLRPHFYEVCIPSADCKNPANQYKYMENFLCMGGDEHLLREARLSFISGHSSFSAYTMVFVVLYLQARMTFKAVKLLRPFIQGICLYAAWFTALSRVSDYKHHWSDVLAGSIQGTLVAILVVFFVSDLFRSKHLPHLPSEIALEKQSEYHSCSPDLSTTPRQTIS